jgi:hypothetical protein
MSYRFQDSTGAAYQPRHGDVFRVLYMAHSGADIDYFERVLYVEGETPDTFYLETREGELVYPQGFALALEGSEPA